MLTFQLGIGLQWSVAQAPAPLPERQTSGVALGHCPGHPALIPKTTQLSHAAAGDASRDPSHHPHDCCRSLGCHCQGVPTLLAPELPGARAARFVLPLRARVVASHPNAPPTEPFRPPIA
jgi:hypothetical protein